MRVINRFISITIVASFALLAVMLATVIGLRFPGLGSGATGLVVFGVLYVAIAIMDLFVDFELINRAAKAGVSADGRVACRLLRLLGRGHALPGPAAHSRRRPALDERSLVVRRR